MSGRQIGHRGPGKSIYGSGGDASEDIRAEVYPGPVVEALARLGHTMGASDVQPCDECGWRHRDAAGVCMWCNRKES